MHDRTGDVPVDIDVANLDAIQPRVDLGRVEAVQAAGQSVFGGVLQLQCVLEILGTHHAQDGTEAFGHVEPRPRSHIPADARCPHRATELGGGDLARFDQPRLSGFE